MKKIIQNKGLNRAKPKKYAFFPAMTITVTIYNNEMCLNFKSTCTCSFLDP